METGNGQREGQAADTKKGKAREDTKEANEERRATENQQKGGAG